MTGSSGFPAFDFDSMVTAKDIDENGNLIPKNKTEGLEDDQELEDDEELEDEEEFEDDEELEENNGELEEKNVEDE